MYLSRSNITELRAKIEKHQGFQIALVPMQPNTFLNVKLATDALYKSLIDEGFRVLVDDRDKKPKNKFEVIEFLRIPHRIVISSRSISAGVYEYKNLQSGVFLKIKEKEAVSYLISCVDH